MQAIKERSNVSLIFRFIHFFSSIDDSFTAVYIWEMNLNPVPLALDFFFFFNCPFSDSFAHREDTSILKVNDLQWVNLTFNWIVT